MMTDLDSTRIPPSFHVSMPPLAQVPDKYIASVDVALSKTPDANYPGRGNCDSPIGTAMQTGYTNAIWRAIHELWGNVDRRPGD